MVTIQILDQIDKALNLSSRTRFSEEDCRSAVSCIALALKMLVNNLANEVGDHK